MTPMYLKLNFEPLTGAVTLVQTFDDGPAATSELQSFSCARRQQLTLTPRLRRHWPEFLNLLPAKYNTDCFLLDFQGPRAEFEKLGAYYDTTKDSIGADIAFRYRGREPEALKQLDYRRRRLRSINREIQDRKYPALTDPALLGQYQDLIYRRLDRMLTSPNSSDWAALQKLTRTAENCLKEASKPADLFTRDLELVQRLQGYKTTRQKTVGSILEKLESLSAAVRCCDWEPLWQECEQALEDLTVRQLRTDSNRDHCFTQFTREWLDRFEEKIGGFGSQCNDEIQALYRISFWRTTILLDENYPLFSAPPHEAFSIPADITVDRLRVLLRSDFDHRTAVLDRERAAFLEKNDHNIRVLTRDADTTGKMLIAGEKQLKSLRRELDAENRQLLAASAVMDEVRILLTGGTT